MFTDEDSYEAYSKPAKVVNRAALPTAPRAARGPNIDLDTVPTDPPFTAFLGNLPFDVSEEEIERFFQGLEVCEDLNRAPIAMLSSINTD